MIQPLYVSQYFLIQVHKNILKPYFQKPYFLLRTAQLLELYVDLNREILTKTVMILLVEVLAFKINKKHHWVFFNVIEEK